eukprot:14269151-Alexandrium_andersonii.AAC.1
MEGLFVHRAYPLRACCAYAACSGVLVLHAVLVLCTGALAVTMEAGSGVCVCCLLYTSPSPRD